MLGNCQHNILLKTTDGSELGDQIGLQLLKRVRVFPREKDRSRVRAVLQCGGSGVFLSH